MTRSQISGWIFTRADDDHLSIRRSWVPFLLGCVLALASFTAGVLWLATNIADPPTAYVGGSRATPPRPVPWAQQTRSQRLQGMACVGIPAGGLVLFGIGYVIFGSEDQRKPFVFDRAAGTIHRGRVQLCKWCDVQRVRVVTAGGGPAVPRGNSIRWGVGRGGDGGNLSPRTGVFLRLTAAPWSIAIDGFSRETRAWPLATALAEFLRVEAVDEPIFPRRPRKPDPPGFPVIPR
jgi:hypothetical protein